MVAVQYLASPPEYYLRQQASFTSPDGKQGLEADGAWWNPHNLFSLPDGGPIQTGALCRLYGGFDPADNKCLTKYANNARRRPAYDIVFSADKSVSALWALADPIIRNKIALAHDAAVRTALSEVIEQFWASALIRGAKFGHLVVSVHILAATFRHMGNVNGEPNLHTHCVIPNICRNDWDGMWRSLTHQQYGWIVLASSTYRNALAWNLQEEIGVHMEHHGNGRFTRIAGMPDALLRQWSQRSRQVLDNFGSRKSSLKNPKLTRLIANRPSDRTVEERDIRWHREADLPSSTGFVAMVTGRPPLANRQWDLPAAIDRLTEAAEQSTIRFWELAAAVENMTAGVLDREGVRQALVRATMHRDLTVLDNRPLFADRRIALMPARSFNVKTPGIILEKLRALELNSHHPVGIDRNAVDIAVDRVVGRGQVNVSSPQIAAIRFAASSHRLIVLEIRAGAERPAILRTIADLHRDCGCELFGVAADSRTTTSLRTDCQIPARTFSSTLRVNTPKLPANRDTVIIIDQAEQLSPPETYRLLDRHRDAKIIFLVEPGCSAAGLDLVGHKVAKESSVRDTLPTVPVLPDAVHFEDNLEKTLKRISGDWFRAAGRTRCVLVRSWQEATALSWIIREQQVHSGGTTIRVADRTGYRTKSLEIAKGDILYIDATSWKRNLTAGTLVAVEDLWQIPGDVEDSLIIHGRDSNGRAVLFRHDEIRDCNGFCALHHGYVLPIAAARNLLVDKVMVLADPGLTKSELAETRRHHRETVDFYVDRGGARQRLEGLDPTAGDRDILDKLERDWSRAVPPAYPLPTADTRMLDPIRMNLRSWLNANDKGDGVLRQLATDIEKTAGAVRHGNNVNRLAAGMRGVEAEHAGFDRLSNSQGRGVYQHAAFGVTLDRHRKLIGEVSRLKKLAGIWMLRERAGLDRARILGFERLYKEALRKRRTARNSDRSEIPEGLLRECLKIPENEEAKDAWQLVKHDLNELLAGTHGQLAGAIYLDGHVKLMQRMRALVENEHLDVPLRRAAGETLEQLEHALYARNRVESCVREIEANAGLREALAGAAEDVNVTTLPSWRRWREEAERLGARARAILADEDALHITRSARTQIEAAAGTRYGGNRDISRKTGFGGLA